METKKKKILLLVSLLAVLVFGSFIFKDSVSTSFKSEDIVDEFEGVLALEYSNGGWIFLSQTGQTINLEDVSEDEIICDKEEDCQLFFKKEDDLTGRRVEVEGFVEEDYIDIKNLHLTESGKCQYEFDDFQVSPEEFSEYKVDFSTNPEAEIFRTRRIEETVEEGVNFAGRYSYAEWGCGTRCGAGAITDPKSGKIIEYGIMNSHGTNFRKDSKLLIINPPEDMEYLGESSLMSGEKSKFYLMDKDGLLLLCQK